MKKINSIWLALLSIIILISCHDDVFNTTTTTTPTNNPIITIESGFALQVIDENRLPIQNVSVNLGDDFLGLTDDNGLLIINNKKLNSSGDLIKASIVGYFSGSRVVYPNLGENSLLTIEMLPLNGETSTLDATLGGEITLTQSDAKITFEADGIINENNGNKYTGQVKVAAHYLNPTDNRTMDRMPGDLTAINDQNDEVALISYSMMAVELRGQNNELLNLEPGSKATLEFPVDADLLASAPSEIPLWFYDEERGKWIEEGKAQLIGNKYVGEVSHFSFWNCDVPADLIYFKIRVIDSESAPLAGLNVILTVVNGGISSSGRTNNNGVASGYVPANELFVMDIVSQCGEPIYTEQIGPFATDFNYGDLLIDNVNSQSIRVSGQIQDCTNNPVINGYAKIIIDSDFYIAYPNDSGNFEAVIIYCDDLPTSLTVQVIDSENLMASEVLIFNVINNEVNTGLIVACGATDFVYFRLQMDTTNIDFPEDDITTFRNEPIPLPPYSITASHVEYTYTDGPGWDITILECLEAENIGSYSDEYQINYNHTSGFGGLFEFVDTMATINWNITQASNGDGYVKGTFSGEVFLENRLDPDQSKNVNMSGEFSLYVEE